MTVRDFMKKILSRSVVGNCLGALIISALLVVAVWVFLNFYTHHGEEVHVPNLCGVEQSVAEKKLQALGLKAEVSDTGYVNSAVPYVVLEQSVRAGTLVKPGRTIYLTINANGPRLIALPDVADNCSRREAEDKLRILGFKLGATEYVQGDPDWVVGVKVNGRNVTAGTRVSVNAPITLVVGAGGTDEEYNGNDSIDFLLNAPEEEEGEIIEGEQQDAGAEISSASH